MQKRGYKLMAFVLFLWPFLLHAQDKPSIVNRTDYNASFLFKCYTGVGVSDWRLHFPENVVDTSKRLSLPNENQLKFKESGAERHFGFSALFGLRWGRFGGGFETSTLRIDSLKESINGQELRFSYHNKKIGFNRFYLEYESHRIPLDDHDQFFLVLNAMAGTYIISPTNEIIAYRSNVFVNISPQIEHQIERWASIFLSANYEFRYFNTKEMFGAREWVYNNYINALSFRLGFKFRLYKPNSKTQEAIPTRVE
jgi:hypothetical protein